MSGKNVIDKLESKGEQFLGKIPYNMAKTAILLSSPAALGLYAGAKILPKVTKAVTSKRAFNLYKKCGIKTIKTCGKVLGSGLKYTAIGVGSIAYLSGKGIKSSFKYFNNKYKERKLSNITKDKNDEIFNLPKQSYAQNYNYSKNYIPKTYNPINITENTSRYKNSFVNNSYFELNSDMINSVKEMPGFQKIYEDVMGKIYERFTEQELIEMYKINPNIIKSLVGDSMNDIRMNKETLTRINSIKAEVQSRYQNFGDRIDGYSSSNSGISNEEIEIDDGGNNNTSSDTNTGNRDSNENTHEDMENENEHELEMNVNSSTVILNSSYEDSIEDDNFNNNIYIQEQINKDINNIVNEASRKKEIEEKLSFKVVEKLHDIEDMQNQFKQMEFDLKELDYENKVIDGQISFDDIENSYSYNRRFKSTLTLEEVSKNIENNNFTVSDKLNEDIENKDIYDNSIKENDVRNQENSINSNDKLKEKEDMDEIYISDDTRVIFKIKGDKVYQQFDFAGRFSKEKEITADEYVAFKRDSLKVAKNREIERQKQINKDMERER